MYASTTARAIDATLLQPNAVAMARPSTSPMAQPVRQWVVASAASLLSDGAVFIRGRLSRLVTVGVDPVTVAIYVPALNDIGHATDHPRLDVPIAKLPLEVLRTVRSLGQLVCEACEIHVGRRIDDEPYQSPRVPP